MISVNREERNWLVRNLALGLVDYLGVAEPPVPVEELLKYPPDLYRRDLGLVEMYSRLWDATFARPIGRRGSIFVRVDLSNDKRRFALAREVLSALITSSHGRLLGLPQLLIEGICESGEYFARMLLVPERMKVAYITSGGSEEGLAEAFEIPPPIAAKRWADSAD